MYNYVDDHQKCLTYTLCLLKIPSVLYKLWIGTLLRTPILCIFLKISLCICLQKSKLIFVPVCARMYVAIDFCCFSRKIARMHTFLSLWKELGFLLLFMFLSIHFTSRCNWLRKHSMWEERLQSFKNRQVWNEFVNSIIPVCLQCIKKGVSRHS